LPRGRADVEPARTAVALNIITNASKTESLLFIKVSLLYFRAIARDTVAGMKIRCILQMGYFVFLSDFEDSRRWTLSSTFLARRSAEVTFHPLLYHAEQLRARGMPLGLMSGVSYEEGRNLLREGDGILFHSDGLVEAHNQHREMFGSPRLQRLITEHDEGRSLGDVLLEELYSFTGEGWEQEDDITLLTLRSSAARLGATEVKW